MGEPDREHALEALTTLWRERGFSPSSLERKSGGTLVASDRQLSIVPSSPRSERPTDYAELVQEPLVPRAPLGRGGMGVVHVAEQVTLRREVAIKRLVDPRSTHALESLLKEAWIGGHLEHPNVVPVHALAAHEGEPTMVMKRIEGRAWRAIVEDPALIPEADRGDALGWHLRVLLAVCDAVQLAHSRGVLHLDLKPDNVMIGAFGEVYVLDWGLAAGRGEGAPSWLPPAEAIRSVAGTPDYMAPELAMGDGPRIDARTDVYLLGAMLHEVVTGAPPHTGNNAMQRLYRAYLSEPHAYGEDVPEELADLLRRSLSRDPGARPADVASFRAAIESFLVHREAGALVREAQLRLERLEALWASERSDEVALFRELGACRFALREAGSIWAEHPARAQLEARLFSGMARWAMEEGRLDLAATYLAELEAPPEALRVRLAELERDAAAKAAHVERLEHLAREEDLSLGSRFRWWVAIALGASFVAINAVMGHVERAGIVVLGYREMIVTGGVTLAVLAPVGVVTRRMLFRNRANSTLFALCITTFFCVQALWAAGLALDVPFRAALTLTPMLYLLTFGAATVLISPRFVLSPLLQVPTVILAALVPEHAYEIIGVGGGASAALIGLAWRPSEVRA